MTTITERTETRVDATDGYSDYYRYTTYHVSIRTPEGKVKIEVVSCESVDPENDIDDVFAYSIAVRKSKYCPNGNGSNGWYIDINKNERGENYVDIRTNRILKTKDASNLIDKSGIELKNYLMITTMVGYGCDPDWMSTLVFI